MGEHLWHIGVATAMVVGATLWFYILVLLARYAWLSAGRKFKRDERHNEDEE
jgi:hypothetical protein